ncbi:electron transport complex subunit E [bacterium]|nr:electron transport complex subunit E [bacterium]
MTLTKEFLKGLYKENPVFRLMLGLCPVLATSTSVNNAIGMGSATLFVLLSSNIVVSLIRKAVPGKIRIPVFIIVIATFVTIVEMVMAGFFPALSKSLGNFISLIVVNCIILGRAEAFASKNSVFRSILDGLGMGLGFALAMIIIATFREILGNGTWLGIPVLGESFNPITIFILSPGAFLTIGYLIGFFNWFESRRLAGK